MRIHAIAVLCAALSLGLLCPQGASYAAALTDPASMNEKAPSVYKAKFDTSKGTFVIEVRRDWAPNGADRFYNLVKNGFFNDVRFSRAIDGFMVQFGINGDPKVSAPWRAAQIKDDKVKQSNQPGYVSFATAGPNTRTTQVFINYGDNSNLDADGFAPFGKVVSGMDVVDSLFSGYGDGPPRGRGPDPRRVHMEGNAYLAQDFPKLDYISRATIAQ